MSLFKTSLFASAVAAAATAAAPKDLQVESSSSVLNVAKTLASGAMSYYTGSAKSFVALPQPYYWWESGALFGAMLDYSHFTNDTTYDDTIATAIFANVGPNYDFIVPAMEDQEGNDDQAFWGFTVLTAAERNFTRPAGLTPAGMPSYLALSENLWNNMVHRWNTTKCDGGFTWQIYASNANGINYKNSVSNGGFFQLSARLARLTGNQTYLDWATKVWDWTVGVGLVDSHYNVFDGTDSTDNCSEINQLSFSYANGIYLYGAAVLANYTGNKTWVTHAEGLLGAASAFFTPFNNATNIMWEHACEGVGTCDTDMKSFKGYLSRFMYASTVMLPSLAPTVETYLRASATAAGVACSGGALDGAPTANGSTCGQKWYVGGFDGSVGLGQEMSALETVQGLLLLDSVLHLSDDGQTTPSQTATAPPAPSASKKSGAAPGTSGLDLRWIVLTLFCGAFVWGMA